jgi:hypothetical protein
MSSVYERADDVVMELEQQQSSTDADERYPCGKPTLEDRLIARMLGRWLDVELARGLGASFSEANAARAQQLTSERARKAVARTLDRLVDRAENPRRASLIGHPAPCREQVRNAMPLIHTFRSRLLSGEPLAAEGIARLKVLLAYRRGPCYVPSGPDALMAALQDIGRSLDIGDTPLAEPKYANSPRPRPLALNRSPHRAKQRSRSLQLP